ncbi:hypothetical protein G5I_09407 [Acromyrmex echinatior]|uniref:Uncharacterized protein n=1 Tax=Acromyrmex echinatior TaxID=103372 RepID=F4WU52_ACREC|nr:hypothetical protein G5I_09407 [Acromyrmex echinatior]
MTHRKSAVAPANHLARAYFRSASAWVRKHGHETHRNEQNAQRVEERMRGNEMNKMCTDSTLSLDRNSLQWETHSTNLQVDVPKIVRECSEDVPEHTKYVFRTSFGQSVLGTDSTLSLDRNSTQWETHSTNLQGDVLKISREHSQDVSEILRTGRFLPGHPVEPSKRFDEDMCAACQPVGVLDEGE